jgi:YD repeat-containing protein
MKVLVTDAAGRISAVTEDPNGLNYQTTYQYDALDDLTRVTQGSQTRTFVFDSRGRMTAATNPENGTTTYGYDDNSNVISRTDNQGVASTYSYDALKPIDGCELYRGADGSFGGLLLRHGSDERDRAADVSVEWRGDGPADCGI